MKTTFFRSYKRIMMLAVILCLLAASGVNQAKASMASFTIQSTLGGPYPDTKKADAQPALPIEQGTQTTKVMQASSGNPESDMPPATEIRKNDSLILGKPPFVNGELKPIPGTPDAKIKPNPVNPSPATTEAVQTPVKAAGWSTIMSEGFEGAFPTGSWSVFDGDGATNGEYYWGADDYKPYSGLMSAWPAKGGADGLDPTTYFYPNNVNSWMIYGPFDLSNSTDAELLFYYWNLSEANYDYFGWYASTNGTDFYGTSVSGNSGGWVYVNFDLTAVPTLGNVIGSSSVWIAFVFTSDMNNTNDIGYDGPFVDNIVLQKYSQAALPNLTPFAPGGWDFPIVPSATTGTHSVSTLYSNQPTYIDWAVINNGGVTPTTFTSCLYYDNSQATCWNTTDGLNQNQYAYVEDWILNLTPTAGSHTLKIIADVNNDIPESNENDNTWERSFVWSGPSGTYRTYLSYSLRDYVPYFEGPWEREPNNTYLTANGPLRSGIDYNGYPNDDKDYFSVYLRTAGHIVIDLSNHNGMEVQLQLFYQNTATPPVASQISAPYHIDYTATTGWYYIYIHSAGNYNSSTAYTLRVTYP